MTIKRYILYSNEMNNYDRRRLCSFMWLVCERELRWKGLGKLLFSCDVSIEDSPHGSSSCLVSELKPPPQSLTRNLLKRKARMSTYHRFSEKS